MRTLVPLLAMTCACWTADGIQPLPLLPPTPQPVHLADDGVKAGPVTRTIDRTALTGDLEALTRAVERVNAALAVTSGATTTANDGHSTATTHAAGETTTTTSERYGPLLTATRNGSTVTITGKLTGEPAETMLRQVCALAELPIDEASLPAMRRTVDLRVIDVPWEEAIDRVLGQVGLSWEVRGQGESRRLSVLRTATPEAADAAAQRTLERTRARAAAAGDAAAEAEARYLLARRESDAHRPVEAMSRYNDLVQAMSRTTDPQARTWTLKAVRGIGDCMVELRQWSDARSVYRNYVARAPSDDPGLPAVYLASAEASRRQGLERHDPVAFDNAAEDLHAMLEKYGENRNIPEVPAARMLLGNLLYEAGRWAEAETQLAIFHGQAGGHSSTVIAARLADCAFQLGRFDAAREGYEALMREWRNGHRDGGEELYRQADQRIGVCHMREARPRYVHALFAFQRAQADFPKASISPELLLNIARCYAEIEREDAAVASLWELMKQDGGSNPKARLDQHLGSILGRMSEYPGPVRAKAMFYIAQAEHRRAERDRSVRAVAAAQAVGYYERVLSENPSPELRDATRLGVARASLLAGNDERGELELSNLLKEPALGERDRAYAAKLLGEHLRARGRLREAVAAFAAGGDTDLSRPSATAAAVTGTP